MGSAKLWTELAASANGRTERGIGMRVIYMAKNKASCIGGLRYLLEKGVEVAAVVAPPKDDPSMGGRSLAEFAKSRGLRLATDQELYDALEGKPSPVPKSALENVDFVISFLFWKRIRAPLIRLPKFGCVNFHPAPLPDFRGVGGYNVAICEGFPQWGASVHFVDEALDTGDIIRVERFPIDQEAETALSLDRKTQNVLLGMFRDFVDHAVRGEKFPRMKQGPGRYVKKEEFEALRKIGAHEDAASIGRKIRAFWYPPYPGATIEVDGKAYTLVDEKMMKKIGEMVHKED